MTIGRICCREVDLAKATESVAVAARRMLERNVGTLIIVDERNAPIGIVTDRDLALKVLAPGRSAEDTLVGAVMTREPQVVKEDWPIESALAAMHAGGFRRVPVVDDDGQLVGVLSVDDVLELLAEETGMIAKLLSRESPRRRES